MLCSCWARPAAMPAAEASGSLFLPSIKEALTSELEILRKPIIPDPEAESPPWASGWGVAGGHPQTLRGDVGQWAERPRCLPVLLPSEEQAAARLSLTGSTKCGSWNGLELWCFQKPCDIPTKVPGMGSS